MEGKPKEWGIMFRPGMIRALRRGLGDPLRKDVTRRTSSTWAKRKPGDRLWVREPWRTFEQPEGPCVDGVLFQADGAFVAIANDPEAAERWIDAHDNGSHREKWRPSVHMPRWACRMLLEVVQITEERGQGGGWALPGVTDEEARREGTADRSAYVELWWEIHRGPRYPDVLYRIEFREVWRAG